MDLVTFLQERLDEDQARTRDDDTRSQWHTATCGYDIYEFVYECSCGVPAQVLRDVEAKRQIVGRCAKPVVRRLGLDVLGLLAGPYSDHPDYDPAWKP